MTLFLLQVDAEVQTIEPVDTFVSRLSHFCDEAQIFLGKV